MRLYIAILLTWFSFGTSNSQTLRLTSFPDPNDTIQFDPYYQTDSTTNQNIIYLYLKGTNQYVAKLIEEEYQKYLTRSTPTYSHTIGDGSYSFDSTMNFYDQFNRLYSSYNYINGIKSKSSIFYSYYDSSSNISSIENFVGNKYNGIVNFYHRNGQLKKTTFFINNKAQGRCISYYENGNIHILHHHQKGKETGLYFKYYKNGTLERKGFLKDNKGVGEWSYYHPNGQLKEIGYEVKNKRYGWWFFYDDSGKFLYPKYYNNGKIKNVPEEIGINLQKLQFKK